MDIIRFVFPKGNIFVQALLIIELVLLSRWYMSNMSSYL